MKTLLLAMTCLVLHSSDTTVWICNSPDAKKYHYSENCRGLNNCKHEVKKVGLSDAKAGGRTLCGWEE